MRVVLTPGGVAWLERKADGGDGESAGGLQVVRGMAARRERRGAFMVRW